MVGSAQAPEEEGKLCQFPPDVLKTRPDPEGTPTPVSIGVYLMDIEAIDDRKETFVVDLFLGMEWKNPALAYSVPEGSSVLCEVPLGQIWHPEGFLFNQRRVFKQGSKQVKILPDGTIRHIQRIYGTFGSKHNFKDFPVDVQRLPIIVKSTAEPTEVVFVLNEELNRQDEGVSIVDWKVYPREATVGIRQINIDNREFPYFEYVLVAKRHLGFYLWKVIVPLAIIVLMSWTVFWISPEFRAAKIGLSATAMLTTIAFQLALVHLLPRVSYLTKMDQYILTCTVFVFLALAETVTSSVMGSSKKDRLIAIANRLDFHASWIFPPSFVGVIVFIILR